MTTSSSSSCASCPTVGLLEPDPTTYADRSVVLELPGRPTVVQELVEGLDAAGLDGHVRVLRVQETEGA